MDKELMEEMVGNLEKVTEIYYQGKKEEGNVLFQQVIPQIAVVANMLEGTGLEKELLASLQEALGAMQDGEYVLLADILQYEIIEKLREL